MAGQRLASGWGVVRSVMSHSRTVLSLLALASVLPSGEKVTENTLPVWPVRIGWPSGRGAAAGDCHVAE